MMVAGPVAAPPSEPQVLTSSVAGNVVTLAWPAPTFGPVTSYILEAGSETGAANLAVLPTGSAATSLVVPGVAPGTYYVRLRAVNAQGVSPPSDSSRWRRNVAAREVGLYFRVDQLVARHRFKNRSQAIETDSDVVDPANDWDVPRTKNSPECPDGLLELVDEIFVYRSNVRASAASHP
jgi:hypothetical protein